MQDQVAQLIEMDIPAAVLKSAIPSSEQSDVISQAWQGAYGLLYISPEMV
jgi:superfamily II DNA helicase RecQ